MDPMNIYFKTIVNRSKTKPTKNKQINYSMKTIITPIKTLTNSKMNSKNKTTTIDNLPMKNITINQVLILTIMIG
jgi:hypothetical protein